MKIDFVGAGWAFPVAVDATGGVALVSADREIQESLRIILGTAPGERPMRPEFGCRIHEHVFGPANASTAGLAAHDVREAIERWEPRVDLLDVTVDYDQHAPGTLYLEISYAIRGDNSPRNLVFPFYVIPDEPEAVTPMLPAPDLDDRDFQRLVDDAKRLVQQRCPEWTDHNVSDPGVTLIEAFAQMVDQLIYRLNRVPERNYVKFLEMIGVTLRPPAAARGAVTFWLSAPQPQPVLVRAGSEVATPRTDVHDPLVFTTVQNLTIVPCAFAHAAVHPEGDNASDASAALDSGKGFAVFSPTPRVGDAVLIGLTAAVPSCAVLVRLDCSVAGVGVDPRHPPLKWEAWKGDGWAPCEVDRDETGGLNQPGDVVLHVPATHQTSVIARHRAGWLRCRLVEAEPNEPTYTASPRIMQVEAFTVGGTAPTVHAEVVRREEIGRSDGTPGQRMTLSRHPVVPAAQPLEVEISTDEGPPQRWQQVEHFAQSGPEDRHFRLDAFVGEVQFGPAVRQADGMLRHFGARPQRGAIVRIPAYLCGGGRRGNINTGQIRVLKSSVPYVARVENRSPSVGGADAESLEDAKTRGPLVLRSRGRAVTVEDFEELARATSRPESPG